LKSELLVFLTPQVVRTMPEVEALTEQEKSRLPDVPRSLRKRIEKPAPVYVPPAIEEPMEMEPEVEAPAEQAPAAAPEEAKPPAAEGPTVAPAPPTPPSEAQPVEEPSAVPPDTAPPEEPQQQ
jgi:hypothetical protein